MRGPLLSLIITGSLLSAGCAQDETLAVNPNQPVGCGAGVAQIAVMDGFLQILCGCAEADGTLVASGTPLTCTVPNGQTVVFQYLATRLTHQILSNGTPTFASSPVNDPDRDDTLVSYGVTLNEAGNYAFSDAFNTALQGTIVVTP